METPNPYQTPVNAPQPPAFSGGKAGIKEVLFSFKGRIPRRTYWLWILVTGFTVAVLVGIAAALFGPTITQSADGTPQSSGGGIFTLVAVLLYIPMIWISLALQAKRWHDRAKSAVWMLINLIPIVGGIWAFVECGCLRGTEGPNQYGPDPT